MRRLTLALVAGFLLIAPRVAHAQYSEMDRQNPTEYSDQDSQLLNVASYALRPVGYLLEWTVARPLHYLANKSPVAPLLGASTDSEGETLPPITELPLPDDIPEAPTAHQETVIKSPFQAPVSSTTPGQSSATGSGSDQPVLH
jgi:hypothetical protein